MYVYIYKSFGTCFILINILTYLTNNSISTNLALLLKLHPVQHIGFYVNYIQVNLLQIYFCS